MSKYKILTISPSGTVKISELAEDIQELADLQNHEVKFNFNGVKCTCKPGGDPKKLYEEYDLAIEAKTATS